MPAAIVPTVCGTAVAERANQIVDDVTAIGNYLACSLETRAEIVVLIRRGDEIFGQIDIDSDTPGAFTAEDEALLDRVVRSGGAFLRLYRWDPPTLSIGRNQPSAAAGVPTVRRPTGGKAVWHEHEVTYAVAAPIGLPSAPLTTNWCQNYSTPLLPSLDGSRIMMMQTDSTADGGCVARFGEGGLTL